MIIESDIALAVGWVANKENIPWKLLNDVISIDMLIEEVACVGVIYTSKEVNDLADYLEKSRVNITCLIWSLM